MHILKTISDVQSTQSFRTARQDILRLFKHHDWQATDLTDPLGWPPRLQHLVELTLDSPLPGFIICGQDRLVIYNGAFAKFCGDRHPLAFGRPFAEGFPDVLRAEEHFRRAFSGEPAIVRNLLWPDNENRGEVKVVDLTLTPVSDGTSAISWLHAQITQATPHADYNYRGLAKSEPERKVENQSYATSAEDREKRLWVALEVAQLAMWDWDIRTNDIEWSDEHFRMEGYEVGEVKPSFENWAARIHAEDLADTLAALNAARASVTPFRHEFRFVRPDGSIVWSSALGKFFADDNGEAVRMIGVMRDVTDIRLSEERQRVLVAELQHRKRNLIGMIQSLARKTLVRSTSLDDFRDRFGDRLSALARVQSLLSDVEQGSQLTFDELLRAELVAHGAIDEQGMGERVTLVGPSDVGMPLSTIQTLALALHELATNAAKYGALTGQGHLLVRWHVEEHALESNRILNVEWIESGVAMPSRTEPFTGGGYGRELIERALPYQLAAKTSFDLGPQGIRCTIELPLVGQIHDIFGETPEP